MDVATLFTERRYLLLIDLIAGLPANSLTQQAMLNDPDTAEQIAKQLLEQEDDGEREPWSPKISEFGLTQQMLAQLIDGIAGLQATTVAANGGKPKQPKPFARPKTEVERAKERLNKQSAHDVLGLFGVSFNN